MPEETPRSSLSDEVLNTLRKSEEALLDAGRKFAEAVAEAVPHAPDAARKIMDQAFSMTDRVLTTQREFARAVLDSLPGRHEAEKTGGGDKGDKPSGDAGPTGEAPPGDTPPSG
jgi:hypothetical protein